MDKQKYFYKQIKTTKARRMFFLNYLAFYYEIYMLKKMQKYNFTPKIISYDYSKNLIVLSYCGEIYEDNEENNLILKKDINYIQQILTKEKIWLWGLRKEEILINGNNIMLCDLERFIYIPTFFDIIIISIIRIKHYFGIHDRHRLVKQINFFNDKNKNKNNYCDYQFINALEYYNYL
jgi:hypothetical protein